MTAIDVWVVVAVTMMVAVVDMSVVMVVVVVVVVVMRVAVVDVAMLMAAVVVVTIIVLVTPSRGSIRYRSSVVALMWG